MPGNAMTEKPNYKAMTLKERLFTAGLLDAFDQARLARDRPKLIEMLQAVEVDDPEWTANAIVGPAPKLP